MIVSLEQMLREFHAKFPPASPDAPSLGNLTDSMIKFRAGLVDSEVAEFHEAVEARDLCAIAKEACDVLYAVAGTATAAGLPLDLALVLVHVSNMTKDVNGTGKAVKGESYVPADPLVAALVAYAAKYPWPARAAADPAERAFRLGHMVRGVLGLDADPAKVNALVTLFGAETVALQQRITGLEEAIAEYEDAISWNTTCTTCARLLNACYAESCRAERAEQTLTALTVDPADEEALGRLVRQVWVTAVRELVPDPKPSWVTPWDELDEFQRTVDKRIGAALVAAGRAATLPPEVTTS